MWSTITEEIEKSGVDISTISVRINCEEAFGLDIAERLSEEFS